MVDTKTLSIVIILGLNTIIDRATTDNNEHIIRCEAIVNISDIFPSEAYNGLENFRHAFSHLTNEKIRYHFANHPLMPEPRLKNLATQLTLDYLNTLFNNVNIPENVYPKSPQFFCFRKIRMTTSTFKIFQNLLPNLSQPELEAICVEFTYFKYQGFFVERRTFMKYLFDNWSYDTLTYERIVEAEGASSSFQLSQLFKDECVKRFAMYYFGLYAKIANSDSIQGDFISMQEYCATRGYILVINSHMWTAPIPEGGPPGFQLLQQ